LALWSFAVATAHGAGLMLLPIYLGICAAGEQDAGHQAAAALMRGNLGTALAVSIVHAAAMIVSGGIVAFAVHEWLGLKFISKSWFNLDVVWALSLMFVGATGVSNAASASALSAIADPPVRSSNSSKAYSKPEMLASVHRIDQLHAGSLFSQHFDQAHGRGDALRRRE
jgi:hypothetical protein